MALLLVGAFAAGSALTVATGLLFGMKVHVRQVLGVYIIEIIEDLGKVYNSATDLIKEAIKESKRVVGALDALTKKAKQLIEQFLHGEVMQALIKLSTKKEEDVCIMTVLRELFAHLHTTCEELFETVLQSLEEIERIAKIVNEVQNKFYMFLDTLPRLCYKIHIEVKAQIIAE